MHLVNRFYPLMSLSIIYQVIKSETFITLTFRHLTIFHKIFVKYATFLSRKIIACGILDTIQYTETKKWYRQRIFRYIYYKLYVPDVKILQILKNS